MIHLFIPEYMNEEQNANMPFKLALEKPLNWYQNLHLDHNDLQRIDKALHNGVQRNFPLAVKEKKYI